MKRALITITALLAVTLLAASILYPSYRKYRYLPVEEALSNTYYELDPREYPYTVSCPFPYTFEARCNPGALEVYPHQFIDGGKLPVLAYCDEQVVDGFFRSLPKQALAHISSLDESSEPSRCSSPIEHLTVAGGASTDVQVHGYIYREQPVLQARFLGKHHGVPRDQNSFEWIGEVRLAYGEEVENVSHHVRVHTAAGARLECLYNPYDGLMFAPDSALKASFICAADLEVVKAFVVDPPFREVLPPANTDE